MSRRPRAEPGDYLIKDDIDGRTKLRSQVQEGSDGLITEHIELNYVDHPQLFVRPGDDPEPVEDVRVAPQSTAYCPVRYIRRADGSLIDQWKSTPLKQFLIDTYAEVGVASVGCSLQIWPG